MSTEPVIQALRAVLAADPGNHPVRTHLAEMLLAAGRIEEAAAEAGIVVAARPDDLAALAVAADAAQRQGDHGRAEAYRRLIVALGPGSPVPPPPPDPDPIVEQPRPGAHRWDRSELPTDDLVSDGDQAMAVPDTADELLAGWDKAAAPEEPVVGHLSSVSVTLYDIGGLEDVKQRLRTSFLNPMRNPELVAQFKKSLRGGLLLWGPPGCGKTYIAKALAGELGATFYEVGLADVLDMWVGSSERNLRSIFDTARRNRPCLLFFDEVDALGQKRSNLQHQGSMRSVVNQLLSELDGVQSDNEGLFVLAASNHPWDIDQALLRPGRFDRTMLVLPPDPPARAAILSHHLAGRPTEPLDLAAIAKLTEGFSGADLALVCEQATEVAMEESMASGTVRPITQRHLKGAVGGVRPSIGGWLETAKNYALYSNESGAYDELAAYLRRRKGSR